MAAGPATAFIETTATSVGAGMLLGGFAAGLVAFVIGAEPAQREEALLAWSSLAGLGTAVIVLVESILG